jgi:hypothetical protein
VSTGAPGLPPGQGAWGAGSARDGIQKAPRATARGPASRRSHSTRSHRLRAARRCRRLPPAGAGYNPAFVCGRCVARTALEPKQTTTSADLQALQETRATGLEPATSGVTGPVRGSRRLTMMDAQSLYSCGFWGFSWSDSAWLSEAISDVCCPFAAREAPLPSAAGTGAVLAPVIVESGSAFDRLPLSA